MRRAAILSASCAVLCAWNAGALQILPAASTNGSPVVRMVQRSLHADIFPLEGHVLVYTNAPACTSAVPVKVALPADIFPTNGFSRAMDWAVVRARSGEKSLWLGSADADTRSHGAAVVSWRDGTPEPVVAVRIPDVTGARDCVRKACKLRHERKDAAASKLLRKAAALDPLDPWGRAERQFLEEDAAAAIEAVTEGRADPQRSLKSVGALYREIGAAAEANAVESARRPVCR